MPEYENCILKKAKNIRLRHQLTKEEVTRVVYALLPFGFVKGRLGSWRVRWQNGKPIIYRKALVYNASQSPASAENRNNMGASFRLAAALNKIASLKQIWAESSSEGKSSYTKLIKHFRKTLKGNLPSIDNKITPQGSHFKVNDFISFDSERTIKINSNLNCGDSVAAVLVPFEPINTGVKEFEVIAVCSSSGASSEIILSDEQVNICRNYNRYILYSAVIRKEENNLIWSDTAAAEGEFCWEEELDEVNYIFFLINFDGMLSGIIGQKIIVIKPPGIIKHFNAKKHKR